MGVKLSELVPKKEIKFEELCGRIIAVDAYNALYQFLSSIRQKDGTPLMDSNRNITSHLQGLFSRSLNLMNKGIKLCYVFDGKPPELKHGEQEERKKRKETAKERYEEAREEEDVEGMYKYSKQTVRLNDELIEESKKLVAALGLPVIQAPSEADSQAAYMCKNNDVYAVGSSDHDSLLHGSPRMVTNLTLATKRKLSSGAVIPIHPELIELKDVLDKLNVTQEQLIVMAIAIGTDYNPSGIKGIGPKKALKLVHEFNDYDRMFKEFNVKFDWKEIFDIFKNMKVDKGYKLEFKEPDVERIKKILVEKHEFSEVRIDGLLNKSEREFKKAGQKNLMDF